MELESLTELVYEQLELELEPLDFSNFVQLPIFRNLLIKF
jgi:hypothetical protein